MTSPLPPPPPIEELIAKPEVRGVRFLFLVGGFAESPMLQRAVQNALGRACRIIIPQDVGLTILKGAVLFGLDPTVVRDPSYRSVGTLQKMYSKGDVLHHQV